MTATQARPTRVELDDVQGLVRFGYKHQTQASFLLMRVKDREAARAWLAAAPVSTALATDPPPETALQVALTCDGLRALGVADAIVEGFAPEFVAGMNSDASRARRLGDLGTSDPSRWRWGAAQRMPHVLVLLYALPGRLEAWQRAVEAECDAGFERIASLSTSDMDGVEPFGFVDGISQPELDWERRRPVENHDTTAYSNLACLGEFLLGYPNEYGYYTERPLLDPHGQADAMLPRAEDAPEKADLGRNGSYLVMRQLRQDIQGFWQFLDRQARGDPALRQRLAEAMVGRTMHGEPLVRESHEPVAADRAAPQPDLNAFTFRADPQGIHCPIGAHVRRANPRNADLPPGVTGIVSRLIRILGFDAAALDEDRVASTRFHRLLRRGREYGAQVSMQQALAGAPPDADSGLHFICLAANIGRQFEFVQSAWLAGTRFDGLDSEGDPLVGHRAPGADGARSDGYSIPQPDGPTRRLEGLPRFVTVLGGAYFFLPGIRALRYLATARQEGSP
jgi:Dyp-type peroxidase family